MRARTTKVALGCLLALIALLPSCSYLRDKEPWTVTLVYTIGPDGSLQVQAPTYTPDGLPLIQADANHGEVQVVNETAERFGFAVPDLAVFEEVPPDFTITVQVDEAKDGKTYEFVNQLPEPDQPLGLIVVEYLEEEFRR